MISPLLANMYLDEVFDWWITKEHPEVKFERYADDVIIHCNSDTEVQEVLTKVRERMAKYGLTLHPEKTKVVYCKMTGRNGNHPDVTFTFLGYEWKPREANGRGGKKFLTFTPAVSTKAKKKIKDKIRSWKIKQKIHLELKDIAKDINVTLQGWIAYYSKYRKAELDITLAYLDEKLVQWMRKKYKLRGSYTKARELLKATKQRQPKLFAHWLLPAGTTTRRAV